LERDDLRKTQENSSKKYVEGSLKELNMLLEGEQ